VIVHGFLLYGLSALQDTFLCQQNLSWPGQENISKQQSTWMALDGGGATVALEDGGHAAALGVGIGQQFKIAATA
jgi:hypothetical protein